MSIKSVFHSRSELSEVPQDKSKRRLSDPEIPLRDKISKISPISPEKAKTKLRTNVYASLQKDKRVRLEKMVARKLFLEASSETYFNLMTDDLNKMRSTQKTDPQKSEAYGNRADEYSISAEDAETNLELVNQVIAAQQSLNTRS